MFGRPLAPTKPRRSVGSPTRRSERSPGPRRRAQVPAGLRPFLPLLALVLVLAGFALAPGVGLAMLLVLVGAIAVRRYRVVKDLDYYELRRQDPYFRSWDDYRHGRGYRGLDSPEADNDGTIVVRARNHDTAD